MTRTIFTLAAAATLFASSAAYADLASEVVRDYEPMAPQIVTAPRPSYPFGVPNVSQFDPNPPAGGDAVRLVPYARESEAFPRPFPGGSGGH